MKGLCVVLAWMGAAVALAQADLGVKADLVATPVRSSQPIVSAMDLLQLVVSLVLVLALVKFALPKLLGKFSGKLSTTAGSSIRIEESAHFANGQLYVVTVRGRTLLLSAGTQGVRCLVDLTQGKPNLEEPPAFFEMLDAQAAAQEAIVSDTPTLDLLRHRQSARPPAQG